MDQLANGGRLVVPVGKFGEHQVLMEILRSEQTFTQRKLMDVAYVPLVREPSHV